ncbi:MAG: DUF4332 domain-containing protein [Myxococcota bacterium]
MSTKLETIEGIGPATADKFRAADVDTVEELLQNGASSSGRNALAKATGLTASRILTLVNMADLMRIKGVGGEYAELMQASGVDTVKELRNRNAENLAAKMAEVNAEKELTRRVPSASVVSGWVDEAKTLDPVVTH